MPSAICPGEITTGLYGEAICSEAWVSATTSFEAVDTAQAGAYFSTGLAFIVVAWAIGKSVALILSLIRR